MLRLSALFALDAFGGGFVIQSLAAYWFHLRFGVNPATLGGIFFGANVLAGVSALLASRLAARFGLVNTMVFTHLPSNVLLMLVPLMPTLPLAIAVLLLRFSISQMDVPTRQSYTMAVVRPDERVGRRRDHRHRAHHRRRHCAGAGRASCSPGPRSSTCPSSSPGGSRSSTTCCSIARSCASRRPREFASTG